MKRSVHQVIAFFLALFLIQGLGLAEISAPSAATPPLSVYNLFASEAMANRMVNTVSSTAPHDKIVEFREISAIHTGADPEAENDRLVAGAKAILDEFHIQRRVLVDHELAELV